MPVVKIGPVFESSKIGFKVSYFGRDERCQKTKLRTIATDYKPLTIMFRTIMNVKMNIMYGLFFRPQAKKQN